MIIGFKGLILKISLPKVLYNKPDFVNTRYLHKQH